MLTTLTRRFEMVCSSGVALLMVLVMAVPSMADTITLRGSARLSDEASDVRLKHIATLEGAVAQSFAELVIAPLHPQARPIEVSVELVRQKLDAAGAHWGKINLTGQNVTVRPSRAQMSGTMLVAMQGVDVSGGDVRTIDGSSADASEEMRVDHDVAPRSAPSMKRVGAMASELVTETTVRGEMARHCARALRLPSRDLRLEFDPEDAAWVSADRLAMQIELGLSGRWQDDRLVVEALVWDSTQIVDRRRLNVWPRVRTSVLTLTTDVGRDHVLSSGDYSSKDEWTSLHEAARLIGPDEAVGRLAVDRMKSGTVLHRHQLRGRTVVRRGDLIHVRCLVGGVAVTVDAEARGDGAVGDMIEVRKRGERDTFLAEVAGPAEAIFDLKARQH